MQTRKAKSKAKGDVKHKRYKTTKGKKAPGNYTKEESK
jgi:hypothetical protein